jgi:ketosteroid isomerase-like protein
MAEERPKPSSASPGRGHATGSIELVKRLFDAFERRDVEAALALCNPDARFLPVTAEVARGGRPYEGHEGIREYFDDIERIWQDVETLPLQYEAVVDAVVVIGEVRLRAAAGELREPAIWSWKLRDGLVVDGRVHSDVEMARRALGDAPEAGVHVRVPG